MNDGIEAAVKGWWESPYTTREDERQSFADTLDATNSTYWKSIRDNTLYQEYQVHMKRWNTDYTTPWKRMRELKDAGIIYGDLETFFEGRTIYMKWPEWEERLKRRLLESNQAVALHFFDPSWKKDERPDSGMWSRWVMGVKPPTGYDLMIKTKGDRTREEERIEAEREAEYRRTLPNQGFY